MVPRHITRVRNIAATLLTVSGISHITELWFQDITATALTGAALGAIYLIIGIGLYGQSRFSLFMGIITPGAGVYMALQENTIATLSLLAQVQLSIAGAVMVGSCVVLYSVRNNASI
jgi:hypothetical protein